MYMLLSQYHICCFQSTLSYNIIALQIEICLVAYGVLLLMVFVP